MFRGHLSSCCKVWNTFHVCYCPLIVYFIKDYRFEEDKYTFIFRYVAGSLTSYNYLAGICGVIPIIFAVLIVYLPESPRYLLVAGQSQKATDALCWLRASDKKCPTKEVLQEIDEVSQLLYYQTLAKQNVLKNYLLNFSFIDSRRN